MTGHAGQIYFERDQLVFFCLPPELFKLIEVSDIQKHTSRLAVLAEIFQNFQRNSYVPVRGFKCYILGHTYPHESIF